MILNNYQVSFYYDDIPTPAGWTVSTGCSITKDGKSMAGTVYCSPNDQFVKRTGRIIALKRAMNNMNLSKEERTVLWREYHQKVNTFKNAAST